MTKEIIDLPEDPEKRKAYDAFKMIEKKVFINIDDQDQAHKDYEELVPNRNRNPEDLALVSEYYSNPTDLSVTFPAGTIVHRNGVFQRIGTNYTIGVAGFNYQTGTSQHLPDGTIVHFSVSKVHFQKK